MIDWSNPKNLEMAKKILAMPEGYEENHPRPSAAELMKQLDEFRDELYKCHTWQDQKSWKESREREDKI